MIEEQHDLSHLVRLDVGPQPIHLAKSGDHAADVFADALRVNEKGGRGYLVRVGERVPVVRHADLVDLEDGLDLGGDVAGQ